MKKEKIDFVRPDEYDDIELELNAALSELDESNARIEALLASDTHEISALQEGAELDDEESGGGEPAPVNASGAAKKGRQ